MSKAHKTKVGFDQHDGIVVTCNCGWRHQAGFNPSLRDLQAPWRRHAERNEPVTVNDKINLQLKAARRRYVDDYDYELFVAVANKALTENPGLQKQAMKRLMTICKDRETLDREFGAWFANTRKPG